LFSNITFIKIRAAGVDFACRERQMDEYGEDRDRQTDKQTERYGEDRGRKRKHWTYYSSTTLDIFFILYIFAIF
jgi:hypothetical protein